MSAITEKADEASVALLLDLMSKDLPLVSNNFDIQNIFKPYNDSLPLQRTYILKFWTIVRLKNTKSPIFSMLAKLQSKGFIKAKSYKKYRKQILNDAKIN